MGAGRRQIESVALCVWQCHLRNASTLYNRTLYGTLLICQWARRGNPVDDLSVIKPLWVADVDEDVEVIRHHAVGHELHATAKARNAIATFTPLTNPAGYILT